ncbi:MAG: class I SAM-dependent methyltransferase [Sulfuricurvum sp.]|uniref:class I SAM-dependent methyltransferase n=1 Tax=Sulfuricurvum sp. TaxID=2025608 RepID=UPI00263516B9|nr:class I SAM-dependent methyltransferase [Sulfuricurvum sp.]MDD5159833.1 class I SAM-dependent methyltransferase [Sulfuricurvum sp.]
MKKTFYQDKPDGYFTSVRFDLLSLIPNENKNKKMLEIGAGGGDTLLYAKQHGYASHIYGIDLCQIENSYQNNSQFDQFIIGDVENIDLPFDEASFDVIICGDVLEHLLDPYSLVKKLKQLLTPNGILIASLPNIREWHVLMDIVVKGDFNYQKTGILDKTHLRFFCKKNINHLFLNNDMSILSCTSNIDFTGYKKKIFNRITNRLFEEFLTVQYYYVVGKH